MANVIYESGASTQSTQDTVRRDTLALVGAWGALEGIASVPVALEDGEAEAFEDGEAGAFEDGEAEALEEDELPWEADALGEIELLWEAGALEEDEMIL